MSGLTPVNFNNEIIITTKTLAEVYETEEHNITKNFNQNKDKFIEGKHYYKLEGAQLKDFKRVITKSDNPLYQEIKFASVLTLWTKRGASRHCKMLGTDKAWDMFDSLEENYFNPKVAQLTEEDQAILSIVNSSTKAETALAIKNYKEIVEKPLQDTIEKQSDTINELLPAANYTKKVLEDNNTLLTITQIAKDFGMSGHALNDLLHDLGVQYKQNGQWLLYSKYQGKGYARTVQSEVKNAKPQTKWTQKGKKFIHDILRKNGIKTVWEQQQEVLQVEQQSFNLN